MKSGLSRKCLYLRFSSAVFSSEGHIWRLPHLQSKKANSRAVWDEIRANHTITLSPWVGDMESRPPPIEVQSLRCDNNQRFLWPYLIFGHLLWWWCDITSHHPDQHQIFTCSFWSRDKGGSFCMADEVRAGDDGVTLHHAARAVSHCSTRNTTWQASLCELKEKHAKTKLLLKCPIRAPNPHSIQHLALLLLNYHLSFHTRMHYLGWGPAVLRCTARTSVLVPAPEALIPSFVLSISYTFRLHLQSADLI